MVPYNMLCRLVMAGNIYPHLLAWASARLACSVTTFRASCVCVFLTQAAEWREVTAFNLVSSPTLLPYSSARHLSFLSRTTHIMCNSVQYYREQETLFQGLKTVQYHVHLEILHHFKTAALLRGARSSPPCLCARVVLNHAH